MARLRNSLLLLLLIVFIISFLGIINSLLTSRTLLGLPQSTLFDRLLRHTSHAINIMLHGLATFLGVGHTLQSGFVHMEHVV